MVKCTNCTKNLDATSYLTFSGRTFCNGLCLDAWEKSSKQVGSAGNKVKKNENNTKAILSTILFAVIAGITGPLVSHFIDFDFSPLTTYKSVEGSYSISLFGKTEKQVVTVNTEIGPLPLNFVNSKTKHYDVAVAYSDYPESITNATTAKVILDKARDGAVRNLHGQLLSELIISINGYSGREIQIEGPQKTILRSRIFLVKNRMYQIIIQTTTEHVLDKKIDDIFNSFSLIEE